MTDFLYLGLAVSNGWYGDRDPTTIETNNTGYIQWGAFCLNTTTNVMFQCLGNGDFVDNGDGTYTSNDLSWGYAYTLNPVGNNGTYTSVSASFNTPLTPNVQRNTLVLAIVTLSPNMLSTSTVSIQLQNGAGFEKIAEVSLADLTSTLIHTFSVIIPAGLSYKITNDAGTASITSVNQFTL